MPQAGEISLSFFPVFPTEFQFPVYVSTQPRHSGPNAEDVHTYKLPAVEDGERDESERAGRRFVESLVSFTKRAKFERRVYSSGDNHLLTTRYLYWMLQSRCDESLQQSDYKVGNSYRMELEFVIERHRLGNGVVWLSPYFLKAKQQHGFLADFRFRKSEDAPFDRKMLQLSLSLDASFRDNSNFYVDRFEKLRRFQHFYSAKLFPLRVSDGTELQVSTALERLPAKVLKPKVYVFDKGRTSKSQFQGVKDNGPLNQASHEAMICFMYRPDDRPLSHDLFRALRGDSFPTFQGMQTVFGFELDKVHVTGVTVAGFEQSDFRDSVATLKETAGERLVVPIVLVPWSRHDEEESRDKYYSLKHLFLQNKLPSQFVSLKTIRDQRVFKWSIANIGLGVFSKLGGRPWKVQPQNNRCLIIGIGQAHKLDAQRRISRFFAYSVLTDSSGLYSDLKILSHSADETAYLATLSEKLRSVFEENAGDYDKFAIHATFSLKRREMEAINGAIAAFSDGRNTNKEFVVLKFDDNSKFFGYDESNNSMVPYESSFINLSWTDYLVWFEGVQSQRPNVRGKIGKPIHIDFQYPESGRLTEMKMRGYLQDALNLSGANWRGFNAKTLPVSVYYAHLIATYFREFNRLGLEELDLEHLTPWFL